MRKRTGQVTLFIILAIAIIALIGGYAFFRYQAAQVPTKFAPIEQSFIDCVQVKMEHGASLLGSHGGYIVPPVFEPGSQEYPTSSQLDFMGDGIPYWFYVSGNGIMKENIPTVSSMQTQLSNFLQNSATQCDFSEFRDQGFYVMLNVTKVTTTIRTSNIAAVVSADLVMKFGNESAVVSTHNTQINSNLGKFYALALNVYNKEKQAAFLENYTVDMLYLYAPTTDTVLSCSPKVWTLQNISNDLKNAFESNLPFIRPGSPSKYYNLDVPIQSGENVRFMYSKDWPTKIYTPSKNGLLIVSPVGKQQGLGVLGFCMVPYHFVYDINYPVMTQIYNDNEFFQFPVNVIIKGNKPREALPATAVETQTQSVCQYSNTRGQVSTYDSELNPILADISFKCFSEECPMGSTQIVGDKAILDTMFPQCVNGQVTASADGYTLTSVTVSSNQEFDTGLVLEKLHTLKLDVKIAGKQATESVMLYFTSDKNNQVAYWPDDKSIELSEGFYNVTAYIYANTSITLPASTTNTCIEVPRTGVLGFFGATTEKCFDAIVPEQTISNAIVGGGVSEEYFIEPILKSSSTLEVNIDSITIPKSLDDIESVYNKALVSKLNVELI